MANTDSKETKKTKAAAAKAAAKARGRAIREKAARSRASKSIQGFGDFIRSQGIVGLAIGFVVGTQAKDLVNVLSTSFINPIVGLILPGSKSLVNRQFVLDAFGKQTVFGWGAFVYALINFLVIAAVIYMIFRLLRLDKLDKK